MESPQQLLAHAIRAVQIGGELDHRRFGSISTHPDDQDVQLKGSTAHWNPVTEVDRESELAMTTYLAQTYPDHGFLGEEDEAGRDATARDLWVIDPIDGTANYIHGIPHYGVSVAYARDGVVQAAACLDPERQELFTAIRDGGAWCNGSPIHASHTARLQDALVCTGFYYDRGEMMERTLLAIRNLFLKRIHGIRRTGSAVLDICWTAAGRFDAFFEFELGPWDFAAAALIAEEAGATVRATDGSPLTLRSDNLACASPSLFDELLSSIS